MSKAMRTRGDTLVEVLMSIVVLSLVIVGAVTLMARGLSEDEIAIQHTQVRYYMAGQTEMLKYLRDGYLQNSLGPSGSTWSALFSGAAPYANSTASTYNTSSCAVSAGKTGFYLDSSSGTVAIKPIVTTNPSSGIAQPGTGMWIELTSSNGISPAYVDVQVRACWDGLGSSAKQEEVTAMRIYDPAH